MLSDTADVSEYNAFGPWIDEVRTRDELPRLYRDHPIDLASARLVLKVPRNIARRDATPGMDLYDHVIVRETDALTVLSRRPQGSVDTGESSVGYDVHRTDIADITAVRDVVNLLDGALTISTRAGTEFTLHYNGSARTTVRRLVNELRTGAPGSASGGVGPALLHAGRAHAVPAAALSLGQQDVALSSDVREVVHLIPELEPWVGHGRRVVPRRATGRRRTLSSVLDALSPVTLQGAVLAGDSNAIEVFGRHEWLLRGSTPVHSSSRLVLPLHAPDRIGLDEHPRYEGVVVATVSAGASSVEVMVPADSPAHRLLADAAGTP
jgi:hypothetical protein